LDKIGVTPTKGFNPQFDICLEFGEKYENEFQKIIESKQLEVKTDRKCQTTGNVYIEYESRGKESGIKVTTASYWVLCIWTNAFKEQTYVFIPTRRLKKLIKTKQYRSANGGDNFTSKGYLVPKQDLLELS
jgi:hypothetical protein